MTHRYDQEIIEVAALGRTVHRKYERLRVTCQKNHFRVRHADAIHDAAALEDLAEAHDLQLCGLVLLVRLRQRVGVEVEAEDVAV